MELTMEEQKSCNPSAVITIAQAICIIALLGAVLLIAVIAVRLL